MTTDRTIVRALADALDEGVAVAMATVVHTRTRCRVTPAPRCSSTPMGDSSAPSAAARWSRGCAPRPASVLGTGRPTSFEFDLVDPAHGDPGVCGGSAFIYLEPFMPQPRVLVIGCGHVGAAVVELAHWLGFRVTALDDRADVADPELLPDADLVLAGPLQRVAEDGGRR